MCWVSLSDTICQHQQGTQLPLLIITQVRRGAPPPILTRRDVVTGYPFQRYQTLSNDVLAHIECSIPFRQLQTHSAQTLFRISARDEP